MSLALQHSIKTKFILQHNEDKWCSLKIIQITPTLLDKAVSVACKTGSQVKLCPERFKVLCTTRREFETVESGP